MKRKITLPEAETMRHAIGQELAAGNHRKVRGLEKDLLNQALRAAVAEAPDWKRIAKIALMVTRILQSPL